MKKVLRGPDGCLRLLWRLLIYFVLHLVVAMGAQVVLPWFDPSSPWIVVSRLLFATVYILGMLTLTYFYRRKVDQRPWSGMGLPALRRNWHFLVGGFLLCVLIFLQFFCVDLAAGFVRIDGDEITASGVWLSMIYALASLIFCVGIGFGEELAFRGYIFQNLGERFPLWLVTLIDVALFGLLHFLGRDFSAALAILPMLFWSTLIFVVLRLSTQSLWVPIGWHTASNWIYFSVLGTFSGGQYGDGHALLHLTETTNHYPPWYAAWQIFIYALLVLLLLLWSRRRGHPIDWRARLTDNGSIAN